MNIDEKIDKNNKVQNYPKTKIKIVQDIKTYKNYENHPLNVFFDQYNEFI